MMTVEELRRELAGLPADARVKVRVFQTDERRRHRFAAGDVSQVFSPADSYVVVECGPRQSELPICDGCGARVQPGM
jgi:hypothetical protein